MRGQWQIRASGTELVQPEPRLTAPTTDCRTQKHPKGLTAMMLRLLTVLGATVAQADAAIPSVTVGNVRVQALSPTLLRVECVPTLSLRRALPLALCWVLRVLLAILAPPWPCLSAIGEGY